MLVVAALPALIAVFGTRDLKQIIDYIASAQFAPVLGIIVIAGTAAWRQWITRHNNAQKVTMAREVSSETAIVKGEDTTPQA